VEPGPPHPDEPAAVVDAEVVSTPETRSAAVVASGTSLVRLAVTAYWRATSTTVNSSLSIARRALDEAATGAPPQEVVSAAFEETLGNVRRILGVTDLEERVRTTSARRPVDGVERAPRPDLRTRGAELLARSAELDDGAELHPAFDAILDELAPDEARILRLLMLDGPQPVLDVQEVNALGRPVRWLARRVSLIGEQAGCRRRDQVGVHLDNLRRLGLVEHLDEALEDGDYQLLDAQPQVGEAREQVGVGLRVRSIRGMLRLTELGVALCEACMPADALAAELESGTEG
jgi:hypothetical protein